MEYSRFEEYLKKSGFNCRYVALSTNIPPSTFSDWKQGKTFPKTEKLSRLADFFGVSLSEFIGEKDKTETVLQNHAKLRSRFLVPVIGQISAGSPILAEQNIEGYEVADVENPEEYFYLRADGYSMRDAGIVPGSLILFHRNSSPREGDIVAVLLDADSATVKRYHKTNKGAEFSPENPDPMYKTYFASIEDFEMGNARIMGVAEAVMTRF